MDPRLDDLEKRVAAIEAVFSAPPVAPSIDIAAISALIAAKMRERSAQGMELTVGSTILLTK